MQADKTMPHILNLKMTKQKEEEAENIPLNKLGLVVILRRSNTNKSHLAHIRSSNHRWLS